MAAAEPTGGDPPHHAAAIRRQVGDGAEVVAVDVGGRRSARRADAVGGGRHRGDRDQVRTDEAGSDVNPVGATHTGTDMPDALGTLAAGENRTF